MMKINICLKCQKNLSQTSDANQETVVHETDKASFSKQERRWEDEADYDRAKKKIDLGITASNNAVEYSIPFSYSEL